MSAPAPIGRMRRSLFGLRRADVEAALAQRDSQLAQWQAAHGAIEAERAAAAARVAQLELVSERLSELVVLRERDLAALREQLAQMHAQDDRGTQALVGLSEELEGLRSQARGQATRIRLRALRDAVEISERIAELARRPAEARERLLDGLNEAIARLGEGDDGDELPVAASGGSLRSADGLFEGAVEIDVGPVADFSQLVGFEDAAAAIAATSQISVTRFAGGRATLELKLTEPVELLGELERRAPFAFEVRERRFDRLVLDVDEEAAAAA